jgi:phenylpyruvate tautomerase PptA (4-oxalocrotonate tautomerase family)
MITAVNLNHTEQIMPFIQCDLEVGLSDEEKLALVKSMTEITHKTIGSAYGHINVVLREHPAANIGEAGEAGRALVSKRSAKRAAASPRKVA